MRILQRIRMKVVLPAAVASAALSVGAGVALAAHPATPIGQGVAVIETNLAYQNTAAAGTGIVVTAAGEVLTNNHVISGATAVKVVIPGTGRSYTAQVVGYSRSADVAVLQLQNAPNLRTLKFGNSATLTVGQAVHALGNAGGTGTLSAARGTITGLRKSITASDEQGGSEQLVGLIETNANIIAGDSGGPLLNKAGRVIGMNTAGSTSSGYQMTQQTDAYAVPIGKGLMIAKQIMSGLSSATVHVGPTAFLGVQVTSTANGSYPGYPGGGYGTAPTSGALIAGVVAGGPAASAGLVAGDVITVIDGQTIASPDTMLPIVLAQKPGANLTIAYADQSGTSETTTVTLGSGPPQ